MRQASFSATGWRYALPLLAIAVAGAWLVPRDRLATLLADARGGEVVFYDEGPAGTVAVIEQNTPRGHFRRLYIQGVSNSGDVMPSKRYMRLQALLPLLIHTGEPESAMVIAFGTGITAGALLAHPGLERRVVVELLEPVIDAAPLFELLGLTPGMAQLVTQGKDEPVQQLQKAISESVEKLVLLQQSLQGGLLFWGRNLLSEEEAQKLRSRLDDARRFL